MDEKEPAVDITEAFLSLRDKLWDGGSTSPAFFPVWTRGPTLSFKRSCCQSDASQITTSRFVIFLPSLVLYTARAAAAAACGFTSYSFSFPLWHSAIRCDTLKAWMTAGKTRSHSHLLLTKDMHSSFWQALTHTFTHICTQSPRRSRSILCRQRLSSCLCNLRSNYLLHFHPSHLTMFKERL